MIEKLFIDHSVAKLNQMKTALDGCLSKLSDQQIWDRQGNQENAVGNLILHLCGNMRQWINTGIGGEPDIRVREAEFTAKDGLTGADLRELLDRTIGNAIPVISGLTAERMAERILPQGRDVSVLEAVYQVVGHFQQHTGQILFVTKRLTGAPLS